MLKIINNVDLKELEKFGFIKYEDSYYIENDYSVVVLKVNIETRKITNLGDRMGNEVFYDLIKADLVEKV